jgi:5-methylcytosine-specific restriction endonuclease McrA
MGRAKKICGHTGCISLTYTTYCDIHTPAAWQSERGNRPHTYALRAMHKQVLIEEPICECGSPSTVAGHIVPRAYGGADVRENMHGQCVPCNTAQMHTDKERYT